MGAAIARKLASLQYKVAILSSSGRGEALAAELGGVNPRAGLLIPDFGNGRTLQLTGRAEVLWDVSDPHNETGGTGRFWEFMVDRSIQIDRSLPGAAEFLNYSPHNPVVAE